MSEFVQPEFDVAIVGGGIAGAAAAWALRRQGLSVAIVDDRPVASPVFKAERVSQAIAGILRELGLVDRLERIALPLRSTATVTGGRVEEISFNTDYSVPLWRLVAELRSGMEDAGIELMVDRVEAAVTTSTTQTVQLRSGRTLQCRLLVVATGNAMSLLKRLGIGREILSQNHSTTFGFDIEPGADFDLPTDSVSIRICKDGADYMNVFPTPDGGHRANLFTYWSAGSDNVRRFVQGDTNAELRRLAPRMKRVTGDWRAVGKVECGSVSVMKSTGYRQAGLVLIGDANGRICPCLGQGVKKALTDVVVLHRHAPTWLASKSPLTWETISHYYNDSAKAALDEELYRDSLFIRNRVVSNQPIWCLRRWYYDQVPIQVKHFLRKLRRAIPLGHNATHHDLSSHASPACCATNSLHDDSTQRQTNPVH